MEIKDYKPVKKTTPYILFFHHKREKNSIIRKNSKILHRTSVFGVVYLHHKTTVFPVVYFYFNITLGRTFLHA